MIPTKCTPTQPRKVIRKLGDNISCYKCLHSWFSKQLLLTGIPPATCPKCHRYDHQEPRKRAFYKPKSGKKIKRRSGRN